jgi:hypothetical protein
MSGTPRYESHLDFYQAEYGAYLRRIRALFPITMIEAFQTAGDFSDMATGDLTIIRMLSRARCRTDSSAGKTSLWHASGSLSVNPAGFEAQPDLVPRCLVFIDETGLSTKMARLRGRAPCGERCRASVPHGRWKTMTFAGALRLGRMTAPFVYDGAMNGTVFLACVEQVLVPTLKPGDMSVVR